MAGTREIFGATIVAVGEFLPAVLSPEWFSRCDLLGRDDLDIATKDDFVVSRAVTNFHTDWFGFHALQNQIIISSIGPVTPSLRDLAVGLLTLQSETLVTAVGLNFMAHYRFSDIAEYHRVGDTLAPKAIWKNIFPGQHIGLVNFQVSAEDTAADGKTLNSQDRWTVTVQPSMQIPTGVFLSANDHRVIDAPKEKGDPSSPTRAASLIRDEWEKSWSRSMDLFDDIIDSTLKDE